METHSPSSVPAAPTYSLWGLAAYMLRLGTFRFAGPAWMQAVFYGVCAGLIGTIAISGWK